MPTQRRKPYNKRKPYCRKVGGPKYILNGKSKNQSEAYVKRDLSTLLGALGFVVKQRTTNK